MNHATCIAALTAMICVALTACDERPPTAAGTVDASAPTNEGAHWEKVCAREYFYRFQDGRQESGGTYCGAWQNKCVDANGKSSADCAKGDAPNAS
jgi:hypothetical protein